MGILTRALAGGERRGVTLSPELWRSITAAGSASGVTISHGTALQIAAVFSCVRVLSETLAMLPLHLYERVGDGKSRARGHALYPVLHSIANPEMTSFTLRETLQAHVATWGNGYAEIQENGRGDIVALWPLRPDKTRPVRIGGDLVYEVELPDSIGGGGGRLPAERVFHVHGLGFDGLTGYSVIRLHREAMGLAMATERFGARFFGNGARPSMVLKYPGQLDQPAQDRLKDSWQDFYGGLDNAHRLAILEEGMELETIGIPPDEAQFLATRKFQVAEIARIFRVPPHLIGDLERATFSNIEHQGIEFVTYTMGPWLGRWEQEITRQLLTAPERSRYHAEFLVDALLRGDTQARYNAYSIGRQNGWLSANDVRRFENMDPIDGGDVYLVPLNMQPADMAGAGFPGDGGTDERGRWVLQSISGAVQPVGELIELSSPALGGGDESRAAGMARHRLARVWRRQYAEAIGRVIRRETNDVGNQARGAAKRGTLAEFLLWLDRFYVEDHQGFTAGAVRPVAFSYAESVAVDVADELGARGLDVAEFRQLAADESGAPWEPFAQRYVEAHAQRHATRSKEQINKIVRRALAEGQPWIEALEAEFDQWRAERPDRSAREETTRFNNALAVHLYGMAGIARVRWITIDKSCPYCRSLNYKVIGIRDHFLAAGTEFNPEGADRPMKIGINIGHPPAHRGCDCVTVAA